MIEIKPPFIPQSIGEALPSFGVIVHRDDLAAMQFVHFFNSLVILKRFLIEAYLLSV
jgi:hypothetical protein